MMEYSALTTPCFVVDTEDFERNIQRFSEALQSYFKKSIVSYSVKTNSLPFLLTVAQNNGCFCEVVSADEYHLAKKMGFSVEHIIYNGPLKDKETFLDAISKGAYVNLETQREIEWLIEYKEQSGELGTGKLGVRLNLNLGILSPGDAKQGEEASRFGFDYENGQFQLTIQKLREHGIVIQGIHAHRTSATRSLEVYRNICKYVLKVINEMQLSLSYIDVGGGYFGNYPGKPDYIDYARTIYEALGQNRKIQIIVEPGNGLVASSLRFITSVIDKKLVGDEVILGIDGTRLDVDPFFHKTKYQYELVTNSNKICEKRQILAGCTCLESDVLTVLEQEKELCVGDRIVFMNQGAYTMTLTPDFIRLLPNVYAYKDGACHLVREKKQVQQWIDTTRQIETVKKPAILFANAGRRATLIKNFRQSIGKQVRLIATDNWCVAPALFQADEYYVTPKITDENYIQRLLEICKEENVRAITTCIDPEIELLAKNRELFLQNGILPLCPDYETARLCFDKYKMFEYLRAHEIPTVQSFDSLESFEVAYKKRDISFPVFIKPRCGSGSVGIAKIATYEELVEKLYGTENTYIIQEYMDCEDFDADVYIDTVTNKAISVFSKKKIETRIGGASKTISFKDEKLFAFVQKIVDQFHFYGPVDMDFFYKDGQYYLSEVNPRFGGAYLHAFGAGVDFPSYILNNMNGVENTVNMGNYSEDVLMLMYDEVVITSKEQLRGDYND